MRSTDILTEEENLVVLVARATCFAFRFPAGEVPENDVHVYVDHLVALFRQKPTSILRPSSDGAEPETLAASLRFCADQLERVAPEQAAKLRAALTRPAGAA